MIMKTEATFPIARNKEFALVTGGSQGIGKCIAQRLAGCGYGIVLVALPGPELAAAAFEIRRRFGVRVETIGVDLTEDNAPLVVWKTVRQLKICVTILVNNAGIGYIGRFEDYDPSYYVRLVRLNALAAIQLTYYFMPMLREAPLAYVLNISSAASLVPTPFKSVYAASKQFVLHFSLALREELADQHISVTTICPNAVVTNGRQREYFKHANWLARSVALLPEQVAAESLKAMFGKKSYVVPGKISRMLKVIVDILPLRMRIRMVYRQIKKLLPQKKLIPVLGKA
jgi:short-subunit dehydrogenase